MCRSNYLVSKHVMLKDASDLRFAFQASAKYPKPKGISPTYTDKYSDSLKETRYPFNWKYKISLEKRNLIKGAQSPSDSNELTDTFPSCVEQASHRDDLFFRFSESSQFQTLSFISPRRKIL